MTRVDSKSELLRDQRTAESIAEKSFFCTGTEVLPVGRISFGRVAISLRLAIALHASFSFPLLKYPHDFLCPSFLNSFLLFSKK